MSQYLVTYIPHLLLVVSYLVVVGLIAYWNWSTKASKKKNPINRDLLRSPGESLRDQIEELQTDIQLHVMGIIVAPLLVYSIFVSDYAFGKKPSTVTILILLICSLVALAYLVLKTIKHMKLRRQLALGYDTEVAVGQELNYLMKEGYSVYHDFPAENFNIDHVVIGPNGVFAVETKGRPKRTNAEGNVNAEVICDGETLQFPGWRERKPLEQASNQAKWLQNWLTSAVGQSVSVYPVLAIPGWFIKREKQTGVPVINGKNPTAFFLSYGKDKLSEVLIKQIIHNVDQRCRTVLPKAYGLPEDQ